MYGAEAPIASIASLRQRPPARALPSLTALRFAAALAILVHHCNGVFWPVAELGPLDAGVSFFFVLSGFILTHVYGASIADGAALRRFHVARIARIWPLHLVCLLLTLLLVAVPEAFRAGALASNALLVHAWIPFDRYFFSYNYVSWSISTELFFYLAFPWLVRRSRPGLLLLLCVALAGVAALVLVSYEDALPAWDVAYDRLSSTGLLYTNPLARIAEFMLGIAAARFVAMRAPEMNGIAGGNASVHTSAAPGAGAGSSAADACLGRAALASVSASATASAIASAGVRAGASHPTESGRNRRWRWTVIELAALALFAAGFRYFRTGAAFFAREVVALVSSSGLPAIPGVPPGPAIAAIGTEWLSHVGLAPFAVVVIVVFAQQRGMLSGLLSQRWLVFLGEASFALYLVHQIGLRLMQQHGLAPPPGAQFRGAAFAAYLGGMLLLAAALHLLVERPARSWIAKWLDSARAATDSQARRS